MMLVEVDRFPKQAVFSWRYEILDMENETPAILTLIEKKWKEAEDANRKNSEEVEEGST